MSFRTSASVNGVFKRTTSAAGKVRAGIAIEQTGPDHFDRFTFGCGKVLFVEILQLPDEMEEGFVHGGARKPPPPALIKKPA